MGTRPRTTAHDALSRLPPPELLIHSAEGKACALAASWAYARGAGILRVPLIRSWYRDPLIPPATAHALRLLTDPRPDVVVVFGSDGPLAAAVERRARALSIFVVLG